MPCSNCSFVKTVGNSTFECTNSARRAALKVPSTSSLFVAGSSVCKLYEQAAIAIHSPVEMPKTGLGDYVQTFIKATGADSLFDIFKKVVGAKNDCKEEVVGTPCQERQSWLNKVFPTRKHFLAVQFDKEYISFVDGNQITYFPGQIEKVHPEHPLYHNLFFLGGSGYLHAIEEDVK